MITRDLYERILKMQPISYSCLNCCYQQYDIPRDRTLEELLNSENFNFLCRKCRAIYPNIKISDYKFDCSHSSISKDGRICHLCFINKDIRVMLSISFNQQDLRKLLQKHLIHSQKLLTTARKENDSLKKQFLKQEKSKKTIVPDTSHYSNTPTRKRRIVKKKSGENL